MHYMTSHKFNNYLDITYPNEVQYKIVKNFEYQPLYLLYFIVIKHHNLYNAVLKTIYKLLAIKQLYIFTSKTSYIMEKIYKWVNSIVITPKTKEINETPFFHHIRQFESFGTNLHFF